LYRRGAYVPGEYRDWLNARVRPLLEHHGLGPTPMRKAGDEAGDQFGDEVGNDVEGGVPGDPDAGYPEGSMPRRFRPSKHRSAQVVPTPDPAPGHEQPRLI
jgi:hypothetical protein